MSDKRQLTRAELVRQRRAERAAQELQQAAKQAAKPLVKVSTRAQTVPIKSAAVAPASKRKFKIALGLPEFHLKKPTFTLPRFKLPNLPQMPRPHANWRIASAVFAVLFAAMLVLAFQLPYFHAPGAFVVGNTRILSEEINGIMGVSGQNIFTVQPAELERRLRLNYPELLSAEVQLYLPNYVYVTVVERQPVIIWNQNGGYTWVDESGVAFRPRGEAAGLITVNALDTPPAGIQTSDDPYSPPPFLQKELVDSALALAPLVPAGSTLTYSFADGFSWQDPRGWTVAFGSSANDIPLKITVYRTLIDSLIQKGRTPVYVNVEYPSGPYYRMADSGFEEAEEIVVENP
ncbi:MAG: FtsQ-type POTRA domain-containing protein [Anaerolineales bacterium]|jgi:cell division septal protein FtsQ|nr:FtsQ-type POTRA domain-containing protein [Chloroflexota bacterium]MBK6645088.1 FtsQ-type POTRA domain-containing protein [Anaerolineales bacterium]